MRAVKISERMVNLAGEWVGLSELAPGGKYKYMAVKAVNLQLQSEVLICSCGEL